MYSNKRSRDVLELPRAKRLYEAGSSLLRRDWLNSIVVYDPRKRIKRNPDGTFTIRICAGMALRKEHVDEMLAAVSTSTEPAFLRFEAHEDGQMSVSVQTTYPAECVVRREKRKNDPDPWFQHLDLAASNAEPVCAKVVWSNELLSVPDYNRKCLLHVHRMPPLDAEGRATGEMGIHVGARGANASGTKRDA